MTADLWVFGYASLIWNPGFTARETVLASLEGYRRAFCMWSIHHRGTPERPGLVLALDAAENAACRGVAFRVPAEDAGGVLAYLRERELVSSAYREAEVPVSLADGRKVGALAYVIERDHVQYCGGLPLEEQARAIAGAVGGRGPNTEYLFRTVEHLLELGIADEELVALAARVSHLSGPRPAPRSPVGSMTGPG